MTFLLQHFIKYRILATIITNIINDSTVPQHHSTSNFIFNAQSTMEVISGFNTNSVKTHVTFCLEKDLEKMKLKVTGRQKLRKAKILVVSKASKAIF